MNLFRSALLALLACLVAACAQPDERETGGSDAPNPLLWEVARSDGSVEGWLMGTIHALPDGARWRNGAIDRAVADADILVMEIDDLDDRKAMAAAFQPLAFSDGQPPLAARVRPEQREQLTDLVGQTSYNLDDFARIESWSAALILAQAIETDADARNGVDRALVEDFTGRPIMEIEGAREQFTVFDGLSESAQRALLAAIVEDSRKDETERMEPITLYLAGDVDGLERLSREGMLAIPEVREALLSKRNARWAPRIERLLAREERPLIAVGAAHMVGDDGLVALLEAEGYRVTRVQ